VLGGARSGKSAFAQSLALKQGGDDVLYVATLRETPDVAKDEEMQARIERHQRSRPATWRTVVIGDDPADEIIAAQNGARVVLLDCLSLFITHVLFGSTAEEFEAGLKGDVEQRAVDAVASLLTAYQHGDTPWVVVSNEVGLGVVPAYASGRAFRDALGRANQYVARLADDAYFVVAGIPQKLK
jgi:adenosylcobinamide kinase/adenosylcobinamide-phosphate guanylyltransferase